MKFKVGDQVKILKDILEENELPLSDFEEKELDHYNWQGEIVEIFGSRIPYRVKWGIGENNFWESELELVTDSKNEVEDLPTVYCMVDNPKLSNAVLEVIAVNDVNVVELTFRDKLWNRAVFTITPDALLAFLRKCSNKEN